MSPMMLCPDSGVGWCPVMAVFLFSRMMYRMSWPSLILLDMAVMPLQKKVESPINAYCLLVTNGSIPLPAAPPSDIAVRLCISPKGGRKLME